MEQVFLPCEKKTLHLTDCSGTDCDLDDKTITANGTYDAEDDDCDGYYEVTVNVQPTLQNKAVTANGMVTPDEGYDGLASVSVNVPTESLPSANGNSF